MKNLVLNSKGDYTLIARVRDNGTVHEYVVAWCYNKETDSWGQGHYFSNLNDAMDYLYSDEIIDWVIKCIDYIDKTLEVDTAYSDIVDREELRALVVDGLYQDPEENEED